jgi:hypothetical protein
MAASADAHAIAPSSIGTDLDRSSDAGSAAAGGVAVTTGIGAAVELDAGVGAVSSVDARPTLFSTTTGATGEVTADGSGQREPTTDGCCTSGAGSRGSPAVASACTAATGASFRIGCSNLDGAVSSACASAMECFGVVSACCPLIAGDREEGAGI